MEQNIEPQNSVYDEFWNQRNPTGNSAQPSRLSNSTRGRGQRLSGLSVDDALARMPKRNEEYSADRRKFYKSLAQYLGHEPHISQLCGKPIDLYHVYNEVLNRGGFRTVTQQKQWRQIFRTMENYNVNHTSASYALKKSYQKSLLHYERHVSRTMDV